MTDMVAPDTVPAEAGDLLRAALRDHAGPATPRLVVVGLSKDENPKATILVFDPGRARPRLVAKVALTAVAAVSVVAEATALQAVGALDPALVGGTVPRLVDVRRDRGGAVLVTEAVPGTPMSVDYHRWRGTTRPDAVRADLAGAASWLQALSEAVGPLPEASSPSGWPGIAKRLRARWPSDPVARDVADAVTTTMPSLRLPADGPWSVVHGDFWAGNVLRTDGRVTGVVDWEHAVVGGDPLRDLTRFALSYVLYLDRHTRTGREVRGHPGLVAGPWGEPVRYLVAGEGWLPGLVHGVLADHLERTGRDPDRWRDVLAVGTAEVAALSDEATFARQHLLLAAELFRC